MQTLAPAWLRRKQWEAELVANQLARVMSGQTARGSLSLAAPAATRGTRPAHVAANQHGQMEVSRSGKVFTRVSPSHMLQQIKSRTAL